MPSPLRSLDRRRCTEHVRDEVFGAAIAPEDPARHHLGVELEWLTGTSRPDGGLDRLDPAVAVAAVDALSPLPSGGRITIEPGGQLELSSAPAATLDDVCDRTMTDVYRLDRWCAGRDVALVALGNDPARRPERVLHQPRYAAMEQYFDSMGPSGRTMMANTASVQINLGLGDLDHVGDRWTIANRIAPVLLAAFANSPLASGRPTGWASTRFRSWWTLDPSRSAPVALDADPADAWTSYALEARVMLIRSGPTHFAPQPDRLTFGAWLEQGHELGWPTLDDLRYHLTTLFPPVRPKGWFEVRAIDALPTPFWLVAMAVAYGAITHPGARDEVAGVLDRTGADRLWIDAAQLGLAHPALGDAAVACFAAARRALDDLDVSDAVRDVVDAYADRWTNRGRAPADDCLDEWRRTGALYPARQSPVPYGLDVRADHS